MVVGQDRRLLTISCLLSSPLPRQNAAKETKLKSLRENSNQISVSEKNAINNNYTKAVKEWRRRRRMVWSRKEATVVVESRDFCTSAPHSPDFPLFHLGHGHPGVHLGELRQGQGHALCEYGDIDNG